MELSCQNVKCLPLVQMEEVQMEEAQLEEAQKTNRTEKQHEAWRKCQHARQQSIKKRRMEKNNKSDELFVIKSINEIVGSVATPELLHEKIDEIRIKRDEHLALIRHIWDVIAREKFTKLLQDM